MGRTARIALGAAVAVVALGAGLYVQLIRYQTEAPAEAGVAALMRAELPDLAGKRLTLAAWDGKVRVVNFWATWCAPCRQEIPGLIAVQREHAANGVQVVGIAVDQVDKVREYAKEIGINYPVLVAGMEGVDLVRAAGNRTGALPFTVILDATGKVAKTHLGLITAEELGAILAPLRTKSAKSG
jgi:thiol-disulfide isomerase/thioredoxin